MRKILAPNPKGAYEILDGLASVRRTRQSGEFWQFRMWIPGEGKTVRESLKTRDLTTALERGKDRCLQILTNVQAGKKHFGLRLSELIDKYVSWRQLDVDGKNITKGRLGTIKSQCAHLRAFFEHDILIHELDRQSLYDYAQRRRIGKPGVSDATIKNEQATFNHLIGYAYRSGDAHFSRFDFPPLKIREIGRRGTFTLEEYDALVVVLNSWCSKREAPDPELRRQRCMIRDCIYLASNSMLRVGELWQLRWRDIVSFKQREDSDGVTQLLVRIQVRAEISKTGKGREITVRGGKAVKRLYKAALFNGPDDYVFCGESGSQRFPRRKFYQAWQELMELLGLVDFKARNITWYSLRHFCITCRLRAGGSPYYVAKIAGTSVTFIDQHYGHFDQEMSEELALKNFKTFKVRKDGLEFNDDA